jgi:outer membrane protein OmpA-like peptidoglycan-associated protein
MGGVIRIGVLAPAVFLLAAGCASRDWVREFWSPKEAELNQRFDKVEGRVSEQGRQVDVVQGRVQGLDASVKEVGAVAKGAQGQADAAMGRANAAYTRAEDVDGRLTRLWNNRRARSNAETIHVQFGFNRWDLSDSAQSTLQTLVKELQSNPKLTVDLQGYTDSIGKREYNVQLSQRRVETVRRYLVDQGVELPRIHSIGLGQLPDNGKREDRAKNRRVTLTLMVDSD